MVLPVPNSRAIRIASFSQLSKVKVDVRDAGGTAFLGHSEEELMQAQVPAQINGTRITNTNSPSSIDWIGELWARSDLDNRNVDFSFDRPL
jgi:hypothetical protein